MFCFVIPDNRIIKYSWKKVIISLDWKRCTLIDVNYWNILVLSIQLLRLFGERVGLEMKDLEIGFLQLLSRRNGHFLLCCKSKKIFSPCVRKPKHGIVINHLCLSWVSKITRKSWTNFTKFWQNYWLDEWLEIMKIWFIFIRKFLHRDASVRACACVHSDSASSFICELIS